MTIRLPLLWPGSTDTRGARSMLNAYALLIGVAAIVPILVVIAIARRALARSSRGVTVSRQWLQHHQSIDL
jgi:hypothetical protein